MTVNNNTVKEFTIFQNLQLLNSFPGQLSLLKCFYKAHSILKK